MCHIRIRKGFYVTVIAHAGENEKAVKKVGDFWVPDIDMSIWSRFGKNRKKTIRYYSEGGPKLEDLAEALAMLPRGTIAIDGGANVGAYSRILTSHFEKIYAYEPADDTFAALSRNIQDWNLSSRIIVRNEALSDSIENVGMSLKFGKRSLSRRVSGTGNISAITIDSLNMENVDFIKLDVEGCEYKALVGARETILRCRPAILFEDKPGKRDLNDQATDPDLFLESLGATKIGCIGRGRFDRLYTFDRQTESSV